MTQPYEAPLMIPVASLSRRFSAWCLDVLFATITVFVGFFAASILFHAQVWLFSNPSVLTYVFGISLTVPEILIGLLSILVYVFVNIYYTGIKGYSLGKLVLSLRVVKVDQGTPIGLGASFTRHGVILATWIILTIPVVGLVAILGLLPVFSKSWKKQAWHDFFAGDVVLCLK